MSGMDETLRGSSPTDDGGWRLPSLDEGQRPQWWQSGAGNAPIDFERARATAVDEQRAAERAAEAKEQHYQNEHDPERDERRGVTRCLRCERLLAMDSRPEFRQLHPCSVLYA